MDTGIQKIAYDKNGNMIYAKDACTGERYYLRDGTPVFVRKPIPPNRKPTPHFARYAPRHRHHDVGSVKGAQGYVLDPNILFRSIFRKTATHVGPTGGGGITPPSPRPNGGPTESTSTTYCKSLKSVHEMALYKYDPEDPRSHSDLIVYSTKFPAYLPNFTHGQLIIECTPRYVDYTSKAIKFKRKWPGKNGVIGEKEFILRFDDEDLFFKSRNRLKFEKIIKENGSCPWVSQVWCALIAGDWMEIEENSVTKFESICIDIGQIHVTKMKSLPTD